MNFDVLRQKILEKAIRGELVPQLESEPEVVQIGEAPEDVPFAIPEKWKWVQLSDAAKTISSRQFQIKAKDVLEQGLYPVISQSKEQIDGYCNDEEKLIPESELPIIIFGDHTRILKYVDFRFVVGADGTKLLHVKLSSIDHKYFYIVLQSMIGRTRQRGYSRHFQFLRALHIPIPPIEEQRRIVAKISQLFDQMGRAEKAYNELSGPLSERFRQLCLEKAIQGKLVPQLESEPEVEQIGDAPEDVPFEIPEKWRWMQLNKVGKIVGGGTPKTSLSEYWDGGTIPWFTPADLGKVHGLYASDSARKITALGLRESSAVMMPPNSVLFSSRAPIGHIALAADSCCTNQGCKSFVPNIGIVLPLWGYFAMKARTPDMIARASGTTFKEISGKGVGETLVPIPPLEEQRRIVTKLSELLNVVRQLENSVLIP